MQTFRKQIPEEICNRVLCYLCVSSLQSLNEILASGSKDDSKAAVEKQVKKKCC